MLAMLAIGYMHSGQWIVNSGQKHLRCSLLPTFHCSLGVGLS
jgi:hypothetical protein